ncbi:hypothetical protein JR316_0013000 [Psilocybe cubensis]|uniref:Uncharacterized protein n=1 Tax=Psilocybe cubensis TaxID=181762 RepID=A0ACB8GG62_PSICU|nr:hypothetical protein JR316_0013000 [Psilocybe cubensis]KAH9474538.1 hypothetical protein JR316_0013000 [Psilocybe cubensis]
MKFTSAIAVVLAALPIMVSAATTATNAADACTQACCDAIVPGVRPSGNVGSKSLFLTSYIIPLAALHSMGSNNSTAMRTALETVDSRANSSHAARVLYVTREL